MANHETRNHKSPNVESVSAILLHNSDNVICLLRDHEALETPVLTDPQGKRLEAPVLSQDIPLGHKVARESIKQNANVIKYGAVIGRATQSISAGEHTHLHNLVGHLQSESST